MMLLGNKRIMATNSGVTQEITRSGQSHNLSVPENTEEYITQVSEVIEQRVTKKQSQELSLTEFVLNPLKPRLSGTVPNWGSFPE